MRIFRKKSVDEKQYLETPRRLLNVHVFIWLEYQVLKITMPEAMRFRHQEKNFMKRFYCIIEIMPYICMAFGIFQSIVSFSTLFCLL